MVESERTLDALALFNIECSAIALHDVNPPMYVDDVFWDLKKISVYSIIFFIFIFFLFFKELWKNAIQLFASQHISAIPSSILCIKTES